MSAVSQVRTAESLSSAADALLLTLEVEAAAARNAELSRTVEELQEELQQLRRRPQTSLPPFQSTSSLHTNDTSQSQTTARGPSSKYPVEEPRDVFLALDDLLFDIADIRSHLPLTDGVDLTPRTFDDSTTVTARALRCVEEVRKLKAALAVSQESAATQVAELRRALGEQVAACERQRIQFALQQAALQRRCDELQAKYDDAHAQQGEKLLNCVIQSPGRRIDDD